MGLLEDAIREHLELKRLRGADPAEVAREQHEALEPPAGEEHAEWPEGTAPTASGEDHPGTAEPAGEPPAEHEHEAAGHAPEAPQAAAGDFPHVGEETAELDMRAVLAEEHAGPSEEDSLEWEMPPKGGEGDAGAGLEPPGLGAAPGAHGVDGKAEDHSPAPGQGRLSL